MSKWDGCPVVACKNDLCHLECQHLKRQKELAIATRLAAELDAQERQREAMTPLSSPRT